MDSHPDAAHAVGLPDLSKERVLKAVFVVADSTVQDGDVVAVLLERARKVDKSEGPLRFDGAEAAVEPQG